MKKITLCLVAVLFMGCSQAPQPVASPGELQVSDSAPVPIKMVEPEYPAELEAKGVGGMVKLKVQIGADGMVESASVLESDQTELEAPALAAIKQWEFKPARNADGPVNAAVVVPVKFELPGARN